MTVAIVLAAIPLTGCGAEDVSPEAVADAAKATVATDGSRVAIEAKIAGAEQAITMTGEGVMDAAGKRGRLEYTFDGVDGLDGEMHQVVDGYVMYMRMPLFESELPDGKSWIKLDLREATEELGLDVSQMGPAGSSDATRTLDYLRATGEVEKEGEEEVRGVATTHYRAVVDLRDYPKQVSEAERDDAERGVEALIEMTGGESELPIEVWVDERDLIRRTRQQMEISPPTGPDFEMDITTELFDFGTPVAVEPPPADEVQDVTDVASEQIQRQQAAP